MIYLDNAATTYPKPDEVIKRVEEVMRTVGGNPGRGSHRMSLDASRVVFEAREALAKLLKVRDASRVAFTKNCTEAVNVALKGILKKGDHLVTTSFEHNSVAKTVGRLESEGVKVTRVTGVGGDGMVTPDEIEGAITKKTKLACVTHASNLFGTILPVAEMGRRCRNRGVPLMIDAAQTVGAVEFDATVVDIVAGTGHKALFGPQGTGFLYVKNGIELPPLVDGGTGAVDEDRGMPERLEAGTMNTPAIGGLAAGVEFVTGDGVKNIRLYEVSLITQLMEGLSGIDGVTILGTLNPNERASLVSFVVEGSGEGNGDGIASNDIGTALDRDYDIMVRCGTHCAPDAHETAGTLPGGAVRVSPGYMNKPEEIQTFLDALKTIIK